MTCEAIAAASLLWIASWSGEAAAPPAPAHAAAPASPLVNEPLFADIIARAGDLNGRVQAWRGRPIAAADLAALKRDAGALAELDMKAHLVLKERGTDGDLKCILRGISEDLPVKLQAVEAAKDGPARDAALTDLGYLLRDNVEVITAPPAPPV
ncbi:MAG TPA: hypothetical protein VEA44_01885 [Caulobacter sp.]|nr:hypothetical protein [Caulobacter sp.]